MDNLPQYHSHQHKTCMDCCAFKPRLPFSKQVVFLFRYMLTLPTQVRNEPYQMAIWNECVA
jgi:hypothetical protein